MEKFTDMLLSSMMDNLSSTIRWNGKDFIKPETVSQHSHFVTWVTRIVCEYLFPSNQSTVKLDAVTYAMFHEMDENITGDLNHNLKYNNFNGDKIRSEVDSYVKKTLLGIFNNDAPHSELIVNDVMNPTILSKLIVKTADWIAMCHYSQKELRLGNKNFEDTAIYCCQKLCEHCDKCIEYFNISKFPFEVNLEIFTEIKQLPWSVKN